MSKSDEALEAWAFNVRLECLAKEGPVEIAIGGAVLDLRDLDGILSDLVSIPRLDMSKPVQ